MLNSHFFYLKKTTAIFSKAKQTELDAYLDVLGW